jgi:hypothetical protein
VCWELVEVAVGKVNIESQRSPRDLYLNAASIAQGLPFALDPLRL